MQRSRYGKLMKVLNLLSAGGVGGIEVLNKDIGRYSEDDNTFVFLYGTGVIYEQMKLEGMKTVDLSRFSFPLRMAKLYELSQQYDIIVSHHGSLGLSFFYVFLLRFNHRSRFVLTHHSCFDPDDYYPYKDVFRNTLRKWNLIYSIKKSDRIIYVSKAGMQSFFNAFDVDRKKAYVVYNGINDDVLHNGAENFPRFDGELRLLYIGRLSKTKGVHLLMQAVSSLRDEIPVKVTVVGDGDERENLMSYVRENEIGGLVSFEGVQTDKQKYYEWANAFIYPSVWQEVFGISIVEGRA